MAKRARTRQSGPAGAGTAQAEATPGAVGPRQPCPCGSGKRYKACHGAGSNEAPYVVRTFEGLPGECDWVALREFVQSGSAPLTLRAGAYDGAAQGADILLASVLPGIAPALRRMDGAVWLGLQVAHQSADPSTDFAYALGLALAAEPGDAVTLPAQVDAGRRLQDVVDPDSHLEVEVHADFGFWFDGVEDTDGSVAATLEQLNDTLEETVRLTAAEAAYWTDSTTREFLRWVLPHDEERLLSALARLHVSGGDALVTDSRLVGSFRAHGLLVPVWELASGTGAAALEEPLAALSGRLEDALADDSALTSEERAARHGLASRQLTIR